MHKIPLPFSPLIIETQEEAFDRTEREPGKWNVLSLWAEPTIRPDFPHAKKVEQLNFHDTVIDSNELKLCTPEQIKLALEFGRSVRGEPLVVHCAAGIGRSTAMAFLLLLDALQKESASPADDAITIVHKVRPIAYPNSHVIHVGIPVVANGNIALAVEWTRELYNSRTWQRIRGNGVVQSVIPYYL